MIASTTICGLLDRRQPGLVAALAWLEPFGLDDLILRAEEGFVSSTDSTVTDFDGQANLFGRSRVAHEVRNEVETSTGNG